MTDGSPPDGGHRVGPLFASHPDPTVVYRLDPDPRVATVNRAFVETFDADVEPGDPLGDALAAGGLPTGDVVEVLTDLADGVPVEREFATADGDRRYRLRSVPDPGEDDESRDGYLLFTETTDAGRRSRPGEWARVVSHDLRNPLDVARIRLDAAEETGDPVHFEKVRQAHDRIRRISRDVVLLSDTGLRVDPEPVDLGGVVEDAWETVDTSDTSLETAGLARIEADRAKLRRLLENLFRNAAEHAGPDVTVSVTARDDGFVVADDGVGIGSEDRDRVFESGESDAGGSGLGLAIVRRIADAHGWAVSLDESDAGGTRFAFTDVEVLAGRA